MRVLITRPREDARRTAELLEARGVRVVTEPLLAIMPVAAPQVAFDGVQAVALTSANGVRALAAVSSLRTVPVYTVGDASARAARQVGYRTVFSAAGDVSSLSDLMCQNLNPQDGAILQVAANVSAGDLQGQLQSAGFEVRKVQLYESRAAVALTETLVEGLKSGQIDAAMFFSPRTAKTFVNLAKKAGADSALATVVAYALSPAVAEQLAVVAWRAVRVADRPEQEALLTAFDADMAAGDVDTGRSVTSADAIKGGGQAMTTGDKTGDAEGVNPANPTTTPVAEPEVEENDETTVDDTAMEDSPGSGGRFGLVGLLLLALVGVGGYASVPFWRDKVPEPYRSYLPDLPPSETRSLIDGLHQDVDTNRTELARLSAEVKGISGELEEIVDAVAPDGGTTVAELGALKTRVEALETRLRSLTVTVPSSHNGKADLDVGKAGDVLHRIDLLAGRIEQQAENLKSLTAKVDQKAVLQRDELADLARRVETVEATRAEAASVLRLSDRINDVENLARSMVSRHDASLANLLAVVQLRAKAADGLPFDAELRTARALADDKAAFDAAAHRFTASAGSGVATTAALRHGFDALSATVAQVAAAPQGETLLDKTLGRVTGLVTVRRIDGKDEGPSVTAILARAEIFINAGDMDGAVKELKQVDLPSAAAVLKPWIDRAEARVALDAALSSLTSDALARVAASAMQTATQAPKKGE